MGNILYYLYILLRWTRSLKNRFVVALTLPLERRCEKLNTLRSSMDCNGWEIVSIILLNEIDICSTSRICETIFRFLLQGIKETPNYLDAYNFLKAGTPGSAFLYIFDLKEIVVYYGMRIKSTILFYNAKVIFTFLALRGVFS